MSERLLREWVHASLLEASAPGCAIDWPSNVAVARNIVAELSKFNAELQQGPKKRGSELVFRILFPDTTNIPTAADLSPAVMSALLCDDIVSGQLRRDSMISGKYESMRFELPGSSTSVDYPKSFTIVVVSSARKAKGGTAGPGEDELVEAIETAGASEDNPITVIIGGKKFPNVTGAVKPARSDAVGGEPKIDVLLLGLGGKGHGSGAFSLKLASEFGGAPTYGGWSRYEKLLPNSFKDLKKFLKAYVKLKKPPMITQGVYQNVGNFSMPVSDEVATFAIYGNAATSGGTSWGKDKVDHVVEVVSAPSFDILPNGTVEITGLRVHPTGDLFRGSKWEPYWLIRGASDRASGIEGLKFAKTRIAVAPGLRAAQYSISANESLIRHLVRETLLLEELTKSDKKEIEKIVHKQIEHG